MIWTSDQLRFAENVRSEAARIYQGTEICFAPPFPDLLGRLRHDAARELLLSLHLAGMVPNVTDIAFQESQNTTKDGTVVVRVQARWSPGTREVELWGGPLDGSTCTIPPHNPPQLQTVTEPKPMTEPYLGTQHTYQLEGWNDNTGKWVYNYCKP